MSYWQSPSPEFSARLEELAALFLACRDSFHEIADRIGKVDRNSALARGGPALKSRLSRK